MSIAFLYAGQGAQSVGMGKDLYEAYPAFAKVYDAASDAAGFDVKDLCFNGPQEQLSQTAYTQPAMVAFAIGVTNVLRELGIAPDMAAGLSLGEYSALYAAGVWDAATTLDLIAFRGRAMAKASEGLDVGMAAVMNLDRDTLGGICAQASDLGKVEMANFNCPGQIVISGISAAVDKASELAKEAGARRVVPLAVSGPFHTSFMKPAGDALAEKFTTVDFHTPTIPVYYNAIGGVNTDNAPIADLLEKQVQSPVYMQDIIENMAKAGATTFVEIGPGKALSGFVRKTLRGVKPLKVESVADIEKLEEALDA